jgi:hypothetical protein
MKYIEKSRIEKFLNLKGYQIDPTEDKKEDEKRHFLSWVKSVNEKIHVPRKEIFQSNELPVIFKNQDLLNEFRKF